MNKKNIFALCCCVWVLMSCNGNKQKSNDNGPLTTQEKEQKNVNVTLTEEEAKEFICKNERRIIEGGADIVFIAKSNFGIPEGDNWIVRLNDGSIIVYAIHGETLVKRYFFVWSAPDMAYDIMKNIPGTHLADGSSSIADFNGDGIDEIFQYSFGGMGKYISIMGYDKETDNFISFTGIPGIPFGIIDPINGSAPVEFMTHNGQYGFKVYYFQLGVAGGPGYESEPEYKNEKWFFYAWDKEQRQYIELEEIE